MKLISTIFVSREMETVLQVQSRTSKGNTEAVPNGPLVVHYRSRVGNESLIFSPSVALVLRSRKDIHGADAWIPLNLFYRFSACLSAVYQGLQTDKLFAMADGTMYVDKRLGGQISRRISLYRNTLTIMPTVVFNDRPSKGIALAVDTQIIGVLDHNEALGLIDTIDHFDISTFSMVVGVLDELESTNRKLDYMTSKLETIEKLLTKTHESDRESPLTWTQMDTKMFRPGGLR